METWCHRRPFRSASVSGPRYYGTSSLLQCLPRPNNSRREEESRGLFEALAQPYRTAGPIVIPLACPFCDIFPSSPPPQDQILS